MTISAGFAVLTLSKYATICYQSELVGAQIGSECGSNEQQKKGILESALQCRQLLKKVHSMPLDSIAYSILLFCQV
jgi:hypothetical protein